MAAAMTKSGDYAFEIGFFESLHKRMPSDVRVASILANLYTETGRVDSGLRMDRKLVRLMPEDPTAHYNLACSLALKDRKADAVAELRTAVSFGYRDFHWMCNDPDLKNLRDYEGFASLLKDLDLA